MKYHCGVIGLGLIWLTSAAAAAVLPVNGDFESGELLPWRADGKPGSEAMVVKNRACYADHDISRVLPRGRYAAELEPGEILRSATLTAGEGFGFIALTVGSETQAANPGQLWVEILDGDGNKLLVRQQLSPASTQVPGGCTGTTEMPANTAPSFSSHYVSTRAFSGSAISIRFRHELADEQPQLFTLIDQLVIFAAGEQALFQSRPYARAGFQLNPDGQLRLSSRGSLDPDNFPRELHYSWYLEDKEYTAANPCLAPLDAGQYRAILYVNDGHHAISDTLHFWTPQTRPSLTCQAETPAVLNPVRALDSVSPQPDSPAEREPLSAELPGLVDPAPTVAADTSVSDDQLRMANPSASTVADKPVVTPQRAVRAPVPPKPDTPLVRQAYDLNRSGIHWTRTEDNQLRIVTPPHFPQQSVSLLSVEGSELDLAQMDAKSDRGISYTFAGNATTYPYYCILRIGHTDYLMVDASGSGN